MRSASRPPLRLRTLAAVVAAAALTAPGLATAAVGVPMAKGATWGAGSGTASGVRDVIVQARPGAQDAVAAAVVAAGGTVGAPLPIVNGFSARVPAGAVAGLRARADVRNVSENTKVHFASNIYDDENTASSYAKASGATSAWARGYTGSGIGVAVIDTGVSPMNDFTGRVVQGPDLSGENSIVDTYGHGTVMGGIIAGNGKDSEGNAGGAYRGVAPGSTLVSVKVAGRNGAADVSQMLSALHWVKVYREQYNIRVLNLSWGTNSTADPATDPLNFAVQQLWKDGVVVVVAAGNSGPTAGTITKPADDPVVISVGAYNDKGNVDGSDDQIPSWTSRGPTAQGLAKPDLVAPGRTLVATRSYGSAVEQENPKALVPPSYIKGSGSSEAAAVTSGIAALLLQAHPTWTPDQVKSALKSTASPMAGIARSTQGAGRVAFAAANAANPLPEAQPLTAAGTGSIEGSRGSTHVYADCRQNGTWAEVRGEVDAYCQPWNGTTWTGTTWTGTTWTGTTWTGTAWTGTAWTGTTWTGTTWTGTAWTGTAWTGTTWTGTTWTSAEYDAEPSGDLFLNVFWGGRPKAGHHVNGERSEPRGIARAHGLD